MIGPRYTDQIVPHNTKEHSFIFPLKTLHGFTLFAIPLPADEAMQINIRIPREMSPKALLAL